MDIPLPLFTNGEGLIKKKDNQQKQTRGEEEECKKPMQRPGNEVTRDGRYKIERTSLRNSKRGKKVFQEAGIHTNL